MGSSDHRPPGRGNATPGRRRPAWAVLVVAAVVGVAALGPALAAWAQEGPARPAAVDQQVRDVMSRPEFSYEPSVMDRIGDWISGFLDRLLPDAEPGDGATFAGGIGPLVAWVIIALAVAAAVVAVVVVIRRRAPRVRVEEALTEAEVEHRRTAGEWGSDAERFEAEGRWKEAVRARYRHLVRLLVDRRQLPDVPGRTTGELRADLGRTTPLAADDFDTCSVVFELAWYAGVEVGADQVAQLRAAAARVLDAPTADRFDPVLLVDVSGVSREPGTVEVGP